MHNWILCTYLSWVLSLSFSCGYYHAMTLDVNSMVWILRSWGRPFRLVSPLLGCSSPETTPIQVECGWPFSAVLTRSGDVYVWPFWGAFEGQYWRTMAKLDKDNSTKAILPRGGTVIPCHISEMKMDPVKLPTLPNLPDLLETGLPEEAYRKETKLIKIAGLDGCLVGLTNKGHVLKLDKLDAEHPNLVWNYVSEYTDDLAPLLKL